MATSGNQTKAAIAYNDEFAYQMKNMNPEIHEQDIQVAGTDEIAARKLAALEALRRLRLDKGFKGGKIYRQKRVRKSRRVSNRRRRNKSIRRRKN